MKRINFVALSLCLIVALGNTALAQCPTGIPPTTIAWNDGPCYDVAIAGGSPGTCVEHVCTCVRTVDGVQQVSIKSITPRVGFEVNCGAIDWSTVIKEVARDVSTHVGSPSQVLPCPGDGAISISITNNICWKIVNSNPDPTGTPLLACSPCTDQAGFCQRNWSLCMDQFGFIERTLVSSSFSPGSCTIDPGSNWVVGTCYTVDLCD